MLNEFMYLLLILIFVLFLLKDKKGSYEKMFPDNLLVIFFLVSNSKYYV